MSHRLVIPVFVAVAALAGCDSHQPPPTVPCPSAGAEVPLGRPGLGRPATWFKTTGGTLRITATGFDHGGPFDPKVGSTEVAVGTDEIGPSPDPAAGTVPNAKWTVSVSESGPSPLDLPPGRYWITSSNAVDLSAALCGPGALEVVG